MEKTRHPDFDGPAAYESPRVETVSVHTGTGVCTSTATGTETFEEGENYLILWNS